MSCSIQPLWRCRHHCSFPALALAAAAAVNSKAACFGGALSFSCLPQLFRSPLASPPRTHQHKTLPSPAVPPHHTPRLAALSPFPAPATDCDERIDRSDSAVRVEPVPVSPSPFSSPPLSAEQRESLTAKAFRASSSGSFKRKAREKEDRTRCRAAAGRLLSVASVSVKRRRRQRLDLLVAQCSAAVETGICRRL